MQLHYGDCLNDISYNDILVSACAASGIAAFTGDGTDSNVMVAATKAIKNAGGLGIPTVKPWNIEVIREKMAMVKDSGAFAVAMDIDAAGLPFLKNLTPPAGSKSVEDLREVKQAAGLPFIVKGIMTVKGAMKQKKPEPMQSLCQTTAGVFWISVLPPQRCLKRSQMQSMAP